MTNSMAHIFRALRTAGGCIVSCFLIGAPVCAQIKLSVFVDPHPAVSGGTIGFTFAGNKFVGSVQGDGLGILYATDPDGSHVRLFAPGVSVPTGSVAAEHHVASSLGLGGFPRWHIYVAAGNGVLHINGDGTSSNILTDGLPSPVRGLLFDAVGTFGHDLLITTYGGGIYRINRSGTATQIASLGEDIEGMDIAPLENNFGDFDGQLVAVSENSGLIRAISPTGGVTVLNEKNRIVQPEKLSFVPPDLGHTGSSLEGFYGVNYPQNILKASADQFRSWRGDAIVVTESGTNPRISRVHWNGKTFDITTVGSFTGQPEGGFFLGPSKLGCICDLPERSRRDIEDSRGRLPARSPLK